MKKIGEESVIMQDTDINRKMKQSRLVKILCRVIRQLGGILLWNSSGSFHYLSRYAFLLRTIDIQQINFPSKRIPRDDKLWWRNENES